jgi:hypothetical protein
MNALRRPVPAAFLLMCICMCTSGRIGANRTYIQIENAKPGTADWNLDNPGLLSHAIEGYASLTSVNRGDQIQLFVNTAAPSFSIDIFRMGYYGGLGGRRMMPTITSPGTQQPDCPMDSFGTAECNWINPYVLNIPSTPDPTDWMSGIYLAKLTASTGPQQYIIFAVRDDGRFTDLIMAQTVNTYAAYNPWGGKSLYGTIARLSDEDHEAMKVSFNRPYWGDSNGTGNFFYWEFGMIQQLEAEGYEISYATNVDVDANPNLLMSHKGFLAVGHDEYWSWKMRDNVEAARDAGISLGFFSGNNSYWQVRYEASPISGAPQRTLVGYKNFWYRDPITPSYFKTNEFRYGPCNRSEDRMAGAMYVTQARPAFCVEDASHWVFTGTRLQNGDCLTNPDGSSFLGYEVDSMIGPGSPANTQRMAHSPVDPKGTNYSDMTMYRAASGATVFATGSIAWSQTVPQIKQITRNVLARFIYHAFADTTPVRPPLPAPFQSQDIGDTGRPGFVARAGIDSFTINGAGQDSFAGSDALYYVYQPLSGDGQIVARLTGLRLYWDNRAGVMIRESLAPDARYVALMGRPSGSVGAVKEGVEFWSRDTAGAFPTTIGAQNQALPNWLKVTRAGNLFSSYVSSDGVYWLSLGTVTVAMGSDVYIGAEVQTAQHAVWATASFDNVSVSSVITPSPPPPIIPDVPSAPSPADAATGVSVTPALTWTGANAISYSVNFGTANPPPAAATGLTTASYSPSALTNGTTYFWQVGATNNGGSVSGPVWSFTTAPAPTPLPSPWQNQDVGNVSVPGSASYASGQFTINGSGNDIWDIQDGFQFVYQPLPSDGEIDAQVLAVQNTDVNAKGGLMLRASLAADSPHVILDLKPSGDIEFMTRSTPGGTTSWLSGAFQPVPSWLRLVRTGTTVTGYSSPDGQAWTAVGSTAITFTGPAYIGMAVVSHTPAINTSTFNNVSVSASAAAPGPDCSSVTLSTTFFYSGASESNWTIGVTAPVAGCSWSVTPDSSWIVVDGTTPAVPAGDGTFSLRVLQNTTGLFRTGHFTIAGTVYTVSQEQ